MRSTLVARLHPRIDGATTGLSEAATPRATCVHELIGALPCWCYPPTIERMSERHADVDFLGSVLRWLGDVDPAAMSSAHLVDLVTALERLKGATAACQARAAAAYDAAQRERHPGREAAEHGRAVGHELSLAMRVSPSRGRRFLGVALALDEMPRVAAALTAGETSTHRAELALKETAHLSRDDRRAVDAGLAERAGGVGALGDRTMEAAARGLADRIDPAGGVRRRSRNASRRRVTLRPDVDGTCRLSAQLPLVPGVRAFAALRRAADDAVRAGEAAGRSRDQVMADHLVDRLTGHTAGQVGDVEIALVMSDTALLADDTTADSAATHEPAVMFADDEHVGPIPADVARGLVREADRAWVRRLFTDPASGDLVAMDSRRTHFRGGLRRFLVYRDQVCRTPWCDAPIRHGDHRRPRAEGGATTGDNGQGLCAACNYAKESARFRDLTDAGADVVVITSTGHSYHSAAPRPPGAPPWRPPRSPLELRYPSSRMAHA